MVPGTTDHLHCNSVEPNGDQAVNFVVNNQVESLQISADCAGTLNGQGPSCASEVQLLNAACQVAFGV